VTETQAAAIKLYHSLGFETFGREPRALKIGDRMMDEDYMILRLTPEQRQDFQYKREKRPRTFQSRTPRQPSPRTAKPRTGY
jgi:hypothetical protein